MTRIVYVIISFVLFLFSFAGCFSGPASSVIATSSSLFSLSSSSSSSTEFLNNDTAIANLPRSNEKGPFDEDHCVIGLRALQSIDDYFAGNLSLGEIKNELSDCYNDISGLAVRPESDPFFAGNDYVKTYVFLAYVDFDFSVSKSPSKKYEDRNYLASALGEPLKEYDIEATNVKLINSFLDYSFSSLQSSISGSSFSYSWTEGSLFIYINMNELEYFYENKAILDAQTRDTVREVSHGYVSGEVAHLLYDQIRWIGGEGFDVFISLGGANVFCVSKNLEIFMDPLND